LYAAKGRYRDAAEGSTEPRATDAGAAKAGIGASPFLAGIQRGSLHREQVLASPLPDMVRANVLTYLT
jgi:hypothetical protein